MVVSLIFTLATDVPAWILIGSSSAQIRADAYDGIREGLLTVSPLLAGSAVIVAAWPWLSRLWLRLCGGATAPVAAHPARAHVASAAVPAALLAVTVMVAVSHPAAPTFSVDTARRSVSYPLTMRATGATCRETVADGPDPAPVAGWLGHSSWTLHLDRSMTVALPGALPGSSSVTGVFRTGPDGFDVDISALNATSAGVNLLHLGGTVDPFRTPAAATVTWTSLGGYSGPEAPTVQAVLSCSITLTVR